VRVAARFLTRGCLQNIQGSSGKPSKEAVVSWRFRRLRRRQPASVTSLRTRW
jgi:hypothetical protein